MKTLKLFEDYHRSPFSEYTLILRDYINQCDQAIISSVVPEVNEGFRTTKWIS